MPPASIPCFIRLGFYAEHQGCHQIDEGEPEDGAHEARFGAAKHAEHTGNVDAQIHDIEGDERDHGPIAVFRIAGFPQSGEQAPVGPQQQYDHGAGHHPEDPQQRHAFGANKLGAAAFAAEGYRNQIFIAEHGSWNRPRKIGYRVMLVELDGTRVVSYEPFAEGWLRGQAAWGRPVDVQVMPDGALLVSDDEAGAIYRITYRAPGGDNGASPPN